MPTIDQTLLIDNISYIKIQIYSKINKFKIA